MNNNKCPTTEIGYCIFADSCSSYYMVIDNMPSACRYVDGFCVYSEYQCIKETHTTSLFIFTSFLYIMLTYLHFSARMHIKYTKNIESSGCSDFCASTCCASCGLAQEYRELP